jgi:hypothetical protein
MRSALTTTRLCEYFWSALLAFGIKIDGSVSSLNVTTKAAGHHDAMSGVIIFGTCGRLNSRGPAED